MEINQLLLTVSGFLITIVYGCLFARPVNLLDLASESPIYLKAFLLASIACIFLAQDGRIFSAILWAVVLIFTIYRLPILRYVESHAGDEVVSINRIVHRYFWPRSEIRRTYAYRRGMLAGLLPWADQVVSFQYVHNGQTYNSMRDLNEEKSYLIHHAETALLKSLG